MLSLPEAFAEYAINDQSRVLLAVSGGLDSMVMAHLFLKSSLRIAIIHCNFRLRGAESEKDELFVKEFAGNHGLDFYSTSFDTAQLAAEKKLSIQMAARELRYTFFEETRKRIRFESIATAHNRDDTAETFLINLLRGSGISGFKGIPVKSGKLIRPLLFANREVIANYAKENKITHREDASNKTTKYLRNKFRHDIIPQFELINPGFRNNLDDTIHYINGVAAVYFDQVEQLKARIIRREEGMSIIDTDLLQTTPHASVLLAEILREYRFTPAVIKDIMSAIDGIPGKQFFSPHCRLVTNRHELIVTERTDTPDEVFYIEEGSNLLEYPLTLHISKEIWTPDYQISESCLVASIDLGHLSFPLRLRKWRAGDYFVPFGMNTIKKLSDFFIDNKLSLPEKENVWLLLSGDQIVWIAGYRIDDRFKITAKTTEILRIEMIR
jgi:tRNA(Ile)-lysidine synthase